MNGWVAAEMERERGGRREERGETEEGGGSNKDEGVQLADSGQSTRTPTSEWAQEERRWAEEREERSERRGGGSGGGQSEAQRGRQAGSSRHQGTKRSRAERFEKCARMGSKLFIFNRQKREEFEVFCLKWNKEVREGREYNVRQEGGGRN